MSECPPSSRITQLLCEWRGGDGRAREELLAAIYPQLHRIAAGFLQRERAGHTLEAAGLVNELYVRLLGGQALTFADRAHFLAVAAQTMRRILIDHARAKVASRRGGAQQRVSLTAVDGSELIVQDDDLLDLERALLKLAEVDSRAARVVELRFFGGLEEQEVADVLGVSAITVKRDWKAARAWLIARLEEMPGRVEHGSSRA